MRDGHACGQALGVDGEEWFCEVMSTFFVLKSWTGWFARGVRI